MHFFFQITIEGYFKENTLKGRHFEDLHHTEKIYRTALPFGYFHISTVRVERPKDTCDFAGQEHKQILVHTNARWLSLFPTLERIPILGVYIYIFLSKTQFFENGETDVAKVCSFPSFIFRDANKLIEVDDKCATESALAMIQPTACLPL
jgi:hypothetical protein